MLASSVAANRQNNFPHGSEFNKTNAPILEPFMVKGNEDEPHLISYPTVAHPNNWQVEDVVGGKVTPTMEQSFSDAHGSRGANWLAAQLAFSANAMKVILDNQLALATYLPRVVDKRFLCVRPTQVSVSRMS